VNRLQNSKASIATIIASGGTLAVLATVAVGCGQHHAIAAADHTTTEASPALRHRTSSTTTNASSKPGGPFVGTCPKVIAATCVPGTHYEGSIVCVDRHGNKATARTPTQQDLTRLNKGTPKAEREFRQTGKLAYGLTHPPSELSIRRLPNGSFYGICEWGGNTHPATAAANRDQRLTKWTTGLTPKI
jgi:hypothetical protein